MKILLYCYAFYPSIGGIEIVTETLARNLTRFGHECTVITEIPSQKPDDFPFTVVRQPGRSTILKLMRSVDVICNVELSLKYFLLSKIARKPLIWIHNGYKLVSIDAIGWYESGPAPLTPWKSILFYKKRKGLAYAVKEGFQLYCRRWASKHIFCNVAGSEWISKKQPLKNQVQIYTPFPVDDFAAIASCRSYQYNFVFLGRLVREKGVEVLLMAFKKLIRETGNTELRLAIIGYGASEQFFRQRSAELQLDGHVFFLGPKRGKELTDIIACAEIAVVPSIWEEPLGGVALQLMAAGRVMIVSKNGGLPEVVGKAGVSCTNGDYLELFERMKSVVNDEKLKTELRENRTEQLKKFDPDVLTGKFIALFEKAIKNEPVI